MTTVFQKVLKELKALEQKTIANSDYCADDDPAYCCSCHCDVKRSIVEVALLIGTMNEIDTAVNEYIDDNYFFRDKDLARYAISVSNETREKIIKICLSSLYEHDYERVKIASEIMEYIVRLPTDEEHAIIEAWKEKNRDLRIRRNKYRAEERKFRKL